jgi:hypothetical protein
MRRRWLPCHSPADTAPGPFGASLVNGNPLYDITAQSHVKTVIKGGLVAQR